MKWDKFKLKNKVKGMIGILILLILIGIIIRCWQLLRLSQDTKNLAITRVLITIPKRNIGFDNVMVPGNLQAWHIAPIFARTNGYISQWFVDIGSRVKKGDLLAVIATPEVDAQLRQAEAEVASAQHTNDLAQITAERWKILFAKQVVSKQDYDEKMQNAGVTLNNLKAAIQNQEHLKQLVGFEQISAPFDGVITQRMTDIGNLINAGNNPPPAIFQIQQINRLRLYVNIPQDYTARIFSNMRVKLRFIQFPRFIYTSKLIRSAQAIEPTTRTLLTEFEIDNSKQQIMPGSYTEVSLQIPKDPHNFTLPINTLLFRSEGLQVAVVASDNTIKLKSIKLGRDFGTYVEVVEGLKPDDKIILNPPDGAFNGQKVIVEKKHPVIKVLKNKN